MAHQDKSSGSMLIVASLLQRGFGFLATFILSRQFGVEAAGLYTSIQISANSVTSPFAMPLAHTATLIAVENRDKHCMRSIFAAYLPAAASLSAIAAFCSCALILISIARVEEAQKYSSWTLVGIAILLSLATVFFHLISGIHHGFDQSKKSAKYAALCSLFGIACIWPVSNFGGVLGALWLAVLVAAVPTLCMVVSIAKKNIAIKEGIPHASLNVSKRILEACPTAIAALTRTGTLWFCSIYLASLHYGSAGVGLITLGLQWTILMHLPLLAWDGRIVASLGIAREQSRLQLLQTTIDWQRRCSLITGLIGFLIAIFGSWIEVLYRLDSGSLRWILIVNVFAAIASAVAILQERLYFCQSRQKEWFIICFVGDGLTVLLCIAFIEHSILAIPLATLASSLLVLLYTKSKPESRL